MYHYNTWTRTGNMCSLVSIDGQALKEYHYFSSSLLSSNTVGGDASGGGTTFRKNELELVLDDNAIQTGTEMVELDTMEEMEERGPY